MLHVPLIISSLIPSPNNIWWSTNYGDAMAISGLDKNLDGKQDTNSNVQEGSQETVETINEFTALLCQT
jgi:hypothetical protein